MILVNFLAFFDATPTFLKHGENGTMTFADLVAPFFLFVLGMMYSKSLVRRIEKSGRKAAYAHALFRYAVILLIGIVGGCVGKMKLTFDWGILQAIGLAGMIALPFMELRWLWRLLGGGILLGVYQVGIIPFAGDSIVAAEHGGVIGTISWATIILFASVAGDLIHADNPISTIKRVPMFGLAFMVVGFSMAFLVPLSKSIVSASYVLTATGMSALVFVLFVVAVDKLVISIPTLVPLGRNALLIFLLHYVLVRVGHKLIGKSASFLIVLFGVVAIYAVCSLLAWVLDRKKLYLKL